MSAAITRAGLRTNFLSTRTVITPVRPRTAAVARFSTQPTLRNAGPSDGNPNPQLPKADFKSIMSTPGMRAFIYGSIGVMATVEGYMWYTYGPHVLGWKKDKPE